MAISPLLDYGAYYFKVTLSDNNEKPETEVLQFRVNIKELLVIVPEVDDSVSAFNGTITVIEKV